MMNISSKLKIEKRKALLCSEAILQRTLKSKHSKSAQFFTERNFRKYFPKYINELQIGVRTESTISKVKSIKILRFFQDSTNRSQSKNLQRTLLYNKEKHIQSCSSYRPLKSLAQDIKTYSGLQTLFLRDPIHSYSDPVLQFPSLKKISKLFRVLVNLKQLLLKIVCEQYLQSISKINSCNRALDSLETLKILFYCPTEGRDAKLLTRLLTYKNILRATTHLNLVCSESKVSHEICHTYCPKLTHLDFREGWSRNNKSLLTPTETPSCFPDLRSLNNLRTLKIRISTTQPFLRDFILSPFIQDVDLDFLSFQTPTSISNEEDLLRFS